MKAKKIVHLLFSHILFNCASTNPDEKIIIASGKSCKSIIVDFNPLLAIRGIQKGDIIGKLKNTGEDFIIVNIESIKPDLSRLKERLLTLLCSYSPVIETASIDSYYLDMTGTERLFGNIKDVCRGIIDKIRYDFNLSVKIGIGENIVVSKLASCKCESGDIFTINSREDFCRRSFPIKFLPELNGKQIKILKNDYNITTINELRNFDKKDLFALFPDIGEKVWKWANGEGRNFLIPEIKQKELIDSIAINSTDNSNIVIQHKFNQLLSDLCFSMREKNIIPGKLCIEFRFQDDYIQKYHVKFRKPTNVEFLMQMELEFFLQKCLSRRVIMKSIKMIFSEFENSFNQPSLFREAEDKWKDIIPAIDKIRKKYGQKAIHYGA